MDDKKSFYRTYDYDSLIPGAMLKLEHTLIYESAHADISPFLDKTVEELQEMRERSVSAEQLLFEKLQSSTTEWEKQGARTMLLDRAIEFLKTPQLKHTANQWREIGQNPNRQEITNMVYGMSFFIYEQVRYDKAAKEAFPEAWYVSWDVYVRCPSEKQQYNRTLIAGQRNKRYTDKAAAEKYLQGRIRAYAHLFTELSPPIPVAYSRNFMVNGHLLPGYTLEGQEPAKTSVLDQLAASKAEAKAAPSPAPAKKTATHEIS